MKKTSSLTTIGILLIATVILLANCKKKDDPVPQKEDPVFTVTATTVQLQGGGDGLQFEARSTNNDVKMTKVLITDPQQSPAITYMLNNQNFVKDQDFGLQSPDEAYGKQTGTWTFIFVGNRTSDGAGFTINASLNVAK
jgi:hypothetical protein